MSESPLQNTEHVNPEMTEVGDFDRETEGYIVIAPLPEHVKNYIGSIQEHLRAELPPSSLWLPQGDQLHITFAHIVSPDANYQISREEVFNSLRSNAELAVSQAADNVMGNRVTFNEVKVFPGAVILTGIDDGTIDQARANFADEIQAPDETRKPPKIIHTTIARFNEPIALDKVRQAVADIHPEVAFEIPSLQLIQEHQMYTQSHTVLKEVA